MSGKKDLLIIVKLAWRNVWKNRRRTILTLLTIFVGCMLIIVSNAMATGAHNRMIEDAVAVNTGHIQIHNKGFWDNRGIEYAFKCDDTLIDKLKGNPLIESFSKRIHAAGLLSYKDTTAGILIQAVDPVNEKKVSIIHKKILPGGRYFKPGDSKHILLGETLAKNLGAKVGSSIDMISQGFDGSIAAETLTVVGLFMTGNIEYDRYLMIMPISQAVETFSMENYINSITIRLKNLDTIPRVKDDIKKLVDTNNFDVLGWEELMPEMVQFIVMDDISTYIFDFILLMVVAFGVLNTIQMSVFERIREFGVMLAIGTRPGQLLKIVMFESVVITSIGIIIGLIAGSIVSYYFTLYPLDFSDYAKEIQVWGFFMVILPAELTRENLIYTSLFIFILSLLFTIFPARHASKLKPIEAIRHL